MYILMVVIAVSSSNVVSPVTSFTAEFQGETACAKAMESVRAKNTGKIILLTCEKKA